MKRLFTVTWGGIYNCNAENEKEAIKRFIDYVENEESDMYGRDWKELIEVEELEE